jgi:AraC-like DNA-binding protein
LAVTGGESPRSVLGPVPGTFLLLALTEAGATLRVGADTHRIEAPEWVLVDGAEPVELALGPATELRALRYPRSLLQDAEGLDHCSVLECLACPRRTEARVAGGRIDGRLRACLRCVEEATEGVAGMLLHQAKCLECLAVVLGLAAARKCQQKRSCCAANACCLQQAACLLEENLAEAHSLPDLARAVGTNEYTLKLGFRELYQTTVFGYLREKRMERARDLFEQGNTNVTEVALEVGYSNTSHFATAFRRQFGMNPKAFVRDLQSR